MQLDSMTVEVHSPVGTSSYNFLKRGLCYFNKKSLSNTPKIYGFTHGLFNKAVADILHYILSSNHGQTEKKTTKDLSWYSCALIRYERTVRVDNSKAIVLELTCSILKHEYVLTGGV
jgi:hypothetical protein